MRLTLKRDLTESKTAAKAKVDAEAEQFRLGFITNGSGQALTYSRKLQQAIDFMAAYGQSGFEESDYPAIVNEVGVTAPTAYEVAQVVLNMNAMFESLGDAIERLRLTAKNTIDSASSPAQIEAAASVDWSVIA